MKVRWWSSGQVWARRRLLSQECSVHSHRATRDPPALADDADLSVPNHHFGAEIYAAVAALAGARRNVRLVSMILVVQANDCLQRYMIAYQARAGA